MRPAAKLPGKWLQHRRETLDLPRHIALGSTNLDRSSGRVRRPCLICS